MVHFTLKQTGYAINQTSNRIGQKIPSFQNSIDNHLSHSLTHDLIQRSCSSIRKEGANIGAKIKCQILGEN